MILDFGLAKFISEKSQMENMRGSPLYMAPEMLLHRTYDVKADLWSVGVIAYECIYGRCPYSSDSIKDLYEKVKKITSIHIPSDHISSDLRDLLIGLLQHNPLQRMDYNQFFKHPFLDLDHIPSPESYTKGLETIQEAVKLDSEKQYKAAFCKYCIGLQYLIPCCQSKVIFIIKYPIHILFIKNKCKIYFTKPIKIMHSICIIIVSYYKPTIIQFKKNP